MKNLISFPVGIELFSGIHMIMTVHRLLDQHQFKNKCCWIWSLLPRGYTWQPTGHVEPTDVFNLAHRASEIIINWV